VSAQGRQAGVKNVARSIKNASTRITPGDLAADSAQRRWIAG